MPNELATNDEGAVLVLIAAVLGMGLLFGLLVLVVDGGQVYKARRQSQEIADLTSISLARDCLMATADCSSSTMAKSKANSIAALAVDGKQTFAEVDCVTSTKFSSTCVPLGNPNYQCSARTTPHVRVYTRETDTAGSSTLPLNFAALIGGPKRISVRSCAQAAWGQTGGAPIQVPIVFSICSFSLSDRETKEWTTGTVTECPSPVADLDGLPRSSNFVGFIPLKGPATGWFDSTCSVPVIVYSGQTYVREASDICRDGMSAVLARMLNKATIVPISSNRTASGSGTITIGSFGEYVLRGYTIGGTKYGDTSVPWSTGCLDRSASAAGNKCVYGKFQPTFVTYQQIDYTVPNLGVSTVQSIP